MKVQGYDKSKIKGRFGKHPSSSGAIRMTQTNGDPHVIWVMRTRITQTNGDLIRLLPAPMGQALGGWSMSLGLKRGGATKKVLGGPPRPGVAAAAPKKEDAAAPPTAGRSDQSPV